MLCSGSWCVWSVDVVVADLDRVHARPADRFVQSELRERVREYMSGLECKNGWTLAEHAGAIVSGPSRLNPARLRPAQLFLTWSGVVRQGKVGGGPPGCRP